MRVGIVTISRPALVLGGLLLLLGNATPQQVTVQDLDTILERADRILEEAKSAYEEAKSKDSVQAFIEAGFKLEECRIKYIVLQEIGSPEKQKIAADRLRAVNQLSKLIHDGKVAVSGTRADPRPAEPPPPPLPAGEAAKPLPASVKIDISKRVPVPDAAKLKDTEKLIKDLYKEQYAKKTQADRKALARQLLAEAPKNRNDQLVYWVLCREAQDQAVQGCDLPTAMKAIDTAAEIFDIDGMALRNAALAATSKTAKTPEESAGVVAASFKAIDELVANDQYDAADKLAQAMMPLAKKAGNVLLFTQLTSRAKDVADAKGLYQGMKGVLETLAKTPDDLAANSEMGKFLCFVKGNWEMGVRFLMQGSDPALKALAEKELAMSLETADQVALGDGWWDLAEKEKSPLRKAQMQLHARGIYEAALPGLASLQRVRIEKRIGKIEGASTPGAINLLKLIDPAKDSVGGRWSFSGDALKVMPDQWARLEIPYEPPAEYDFKIVFTRNDGNGDAMQIVSRDGRQFTWCLGCKANTQMGFGVVNGAWVHIETNPTLRTVPSVLTNGKTYTSLVQVRNGLLKAFLDGKLIVEYPTTYGELSQHPNMPLRSARTLGVAAWLSTITFHQIELVEVGGKGKKIR